MKKLLLLSTIYLAACQGDLGGTTSNSSRLTVLNQAVEVDSVSAHSVSGQAVVDPALLAQVPTLTLVASIAPPSVNGAILQASDITMSGTKAYVAYNTAGNGRAVLNKIGLSALGDLTGTVASTQLTNNVGVLAYAGISVLTSGLNIYALSGNNGGLTILNSSDLSQVSQTQIEDARDLSRASNGDLFVLSGKTASSEVAIQRYTSAGVLTGSPITISGSVADEGRSSIYTGSIAHIATAGQAGVRVICASNPSNVIGTIANPTVSGLTADKTTANAVAYGNGLIYVANGGAGVYIYGVERTLFQSGCTGVSVAYLGSFNFGDGTSVNNIYYQNGFLVAATGEGGFKIISVIQSVVSGLLIGL